MNKLVEYLLQNPLYILPFILLPLGILYLAINAIKKPLKKANKPEVAKEVEELSKERKTANSLVEVADVENCFLYRKDDYILGYLRIGSINLELLSAEELQILTQRLSMSFEGDRDNFDYFTLPSQVNLDPNKDFIKEIRQGTDDIGKRKGLTLMMQEMTRLSTSGENFEHQHIIKIWKKIGSNIKDTEKDLRNRLSDFRERYQAVGIPCEILKDKEIIKLCNLFGNPLQAPYTGEVSKFENYPFIKEI